MSSGCSSTNPLSFVTRNRQSMRGALRLGLAVCCVLAFCCAAYAQSTFGTVLGTVKDPSGSLIPGATVTLMNTGTNAEHTTTTNTNGAYDFVNVEIGNYKLSVEAPGFQKTEYQAFDLLARATMRIDIDLKVASQATSVTVEAVAVIQTDASNIAETKGSIELTDLPVAISTRSSGSTSAYATLGAQPGVQFDSNNNIEVAGAGPSQLSFSIDGISSVGPGSLGALQEMFPSFNSIEEIKISENLNPAEFGGVADVTTVSKSGTNSLHGGAFENVQNTDFNAADTFANQVTEDKLNNFGIYLGGPVMFPKLYDGRNKTFFFGSFEVLRLPKSQTFVNSVPTEAMRNGDLSAYLNPALGGDGVMLNGYPGNIIPKSQLNPFSQNLLNLLYPLPNYGPPGAIANNYLGVYPSPINSTQGDVRLDQSLGPKHMIFVRWTHKNRRITGPQEQGFNPSNPSTTLLGGVSRPEIYNSLATSYNWVISPTLVNELRGGFSIISRNVTGGLTSQQSATALGLTTGPGALPGTLPPGYDAPTVVISGFMGYQAQSNDLNPHEGTYEVTDSLTWTKGKHTYKFGADYRYLSSLNTQVFNDYRMGQYEYNGSVMSGLLGSAAATPIASFLLGYPDLTTIATVINPNTDAYANAFAVYGQDDYKLSESLTINYGLRWEYHPGFQDKNNNMVNFDPYYQNIVNGRNTGAVIADNQANLNTNINPGFVQSISPTPLILASAAGIGPSNREASHLDFAPRIGFAWRVFNNNKTVLRGGYGRFIESLLSGTAIDGWSVGSSDVGNFANSIVGGVPTLKAPYSYPSNIAVQGSQFFDLAAEVHYKDPIVEEWDLTLEQELGKGVGLRASYDGNHGYNIPTAANADQPAVNTVGFANLPQSAIPFPLMSYIATTDSLGFANYNAGTISMKKHSANLQFEISYTYTRDLSNINGAPISSAAAYSNELGSTLSDPYHPGLDYGNVPYARRERVVASFLYNLPAGKGQAWLNSNSVLDKIVGGWQLGGLLLFQSGPFMSTSVLSDPSGTGYNIYGNLYAIGGRADTVQGVGPYQGQTTHNWSSPNSYYINPNAFVDPCANACANGTAIGRFGDETSGSIVGPGTQSVSLSLIKRFTVKERLRFEVGMQVSNAFNHPNYAPPSVLTVGVAGFGQLTGLQGGGGYNADSAGPRQLQLTGRLTF
ncbi:MAG TPA: TonB-dependent receptor [Bryobacteraceae bacterium]|nr:TonB-dependent receptor [Bryobacteraceae bacterium]